uniref:Cystatin fetuin-A-type domain-containing protein n=1 Tax=Bubo bubo TaxID=30461 RepID=A0A8C0FN47_BUBBB
MKALVALILLVQLPIHKAVPAAPPAPLGCDDPESEAAAEVAVSYINGHSHHGYKFALNRIENIRVLPQGLNNDIIFLELDLLETRCHILSPTPLANCTVRSFTEHVKAKLSSFRFLRKCYITGTVYNHPITYSSEDILRLCPDCPLLESLNNTDVLATVTAALNDHNSKTTDAYLRLLEIGRPSIYTDYFFSGNCAVLAKEAKDNVEACQLLPDDQSVSMPAHQP